MQFKSNVIIQHDPILEYNRGIKVDPQASRHFYTFLSSINQAFVDLKLQSKALYTSKILVCLFISFRAESWPEGIKEISHCTLLQQQQINGKNMNFKMQVEYVHCLLRPDFNLNHVTWVKKSKPIKSNKCGRVWYWIKDCMLVLQDLAWKYFERIIVTADVLEDKADQSSNKKRTRTVMNKGTRNMQSLTSSDCVFTSYNLHELLMHIQSINLNIKS